jgi:hypothetical protein
MDMKAFQKTTYIIIGLIIDNYIIFIGKLSISCINLIVILLTIAINHYLFIYIILLYIIISSPIDVVISTIEVPILHQLNYYFGSWPIRFAEDLHLLLKKLIIIIIIIGEKISKKQKK